MFTDHQQEAVQLVLTSFAALHPSLLLEAVSMFSAEFAAKAFLLFPPKLQKFWVRQQLLKRRSTLEQEDYDGMSFNDVMESVVWDGDGDLLEKQADRIDGADES